MNRCFSTLHEVTGSGQPCVLVTVAHIAGSAPREPGARMIVTTGRIIGTIGGGNLEYEAIRIARSRLDEPAETRFVELFPLGSMLQQCCGGAVFLHFEVLTNGRTDWVAAAAEQELGNKRTVLASRIGAEQSPPSKMIFSGTAVTGSLGDITLDELAALKAQALLSSDGTPQTTLLHSLVETRSSLPDTSDALFFELIAPTDFHVVLFGAGHVGRALVSALVEATDCRITWIDSRAGQFPDNLPHNVEARLAEDPVREAAGLSKGAYCLVMTHSHELDQDLCEALLRRSDFTFLGLIGSATKRRRFVQRLKEKGIGGEQLEQLTCPIGIPGIEAKEPGVIAVAVAAQLLKIKSADDADKNPDRSVLSVEKTGKLRN